MPDSRESSNQAKTATPYGVLWGLCERQMLVFSRPPLAGLEAAEANSFSLARSLEAAEETEWNGGSEFLGTKNSDPQPSII